MSNKKRISLLTDSEIDEIYNFPEFNDHERKLYFTFDSHQWSLINASDLPTLMIHIMLKIGYFKARQQFYAFNHDLMASDICYLIEQYFTNDQEFPKTPDKRTEKNQKDLVLAGFGYQLHSKKDERVTEHLSMLIRHYPRPHNAARELIKYFEKMKIVLPTYRTLQDLYSDSYAQEMTHLNDLIDKIPSRITTTLNDLIYKEDENDVVSLKEMRYDQKNFSYSEVRGGINKINALTEIYWFSKEFLPKTKLANNAIRYYSNIVEQYPASRLRKLTKSLQCLYSICFIYNRYQVFADHAIVSFLHYMQILKSEVKEHVEKQLSQYITSIVKKYPNLVKFFRWFPSQENQHLLADKRLFEEAYKILPKEDFEKFAQYFEGADFDVKAERWRYFEDNFNTVSMYLRPIVLALNLEHYKKDNSIIALIQMLKDHYSKNKKPKDLKLSDNLGLSLPKHIVPYLRSTFQDKYINPHRFEFYVYEKLYHHLDRGRMFCNDSVSYKNIDDDFVADDMVDKAPEIAERFGYPKLAAYCDDRLDNLLNELDAKWEHVLNRISTGQNENIHISYDDKGQASWQLDYAASIEHDDSFFKDLNKMDISEIFNFVDNNTDIFDSFTHLKGRYIKRTKPTTVAITACILSEAFGFGVAKMAEMSDLNYNTLRYTHEDFIRFETLNDANISIANHVNKLSIFKAWNLLEDKLIADDDGQKASTKTSTIKSRYSKKYLGKGNGLSVLSLIANFIAVNVKNIGLNEYEGHYLYDMIYSNRSEIKIQAVTGDNHSVNKINFVALDVIDVEYMPSIKNVVSEADELYSFSDLPQFDGAIIKPKDKINLECIRKYKREITRALLSLILQENTQATIIRKLNSHDRYAGLRKALYEYNKIFKSLHILNMIDDMPMRKAMKIARNRTESYHQLQKLIRNMYYGIFKSKRIAGQDVSTQAVRLVSNVIVAYNAIILNSLYEKMVRNGATTEELEEFLRISPMAWIHITFTGRYKFNGGEINIDLQEIISSLEKQLKKLGIIRS